MRTYRAFMFYLRRRRQLTGATSAITNGILQEGSTTFFIMMENGTDYILQE